MIVLLIGSPGSGKGTQGQLLAQKLNLPYISTGDLFRVMVKSQDKEGILLNEYMSQGKLVPDSLVNKVVERFLLLDKYKDGCVLDGYPRNVEQAKFLEGVTKQNIKVIYFDIDDQVVLERVLGRFSCENCGRIYNSYFVKPQIDNICDICGADKFIYRNDDGEQIIKSRLEEYKVETYPLIDYYQNNVEVYNIDASQSQSQVELALDRILSSMLKNS